MKISKEEFKTFVDECNRWVDFFGLKDWKIYYYQEKLKESFAECRVNGIENRIVSIVLNKELDKEDYDFFDLRKTAFHEVCEVLLYGLEYLATCRYLSPEEITTERHSIIRRLENSVYRELNKELNKPV